MVIRSGSNSRTRGRNIGFFFAFLCICSSIYVTFLTNQHFEKHVTEKKSLATHVLSTNTSNVVFSPLSIDTVLRSVAVGSSGETLKQLLSYLKAESIDDVNAGSQHVSSVLADVSRFGGPLLRFANGIWADQSTISFHPYFEQTVKNLHNATCMQGDFQNKPAEVADEVNLWVEKQTSGLIKDAVPVDAASNQTALLFANALYFKGVWKEKFDRSMTKLHYFYRLDGSTVQVPYITTNRKKQILRKYDGFKVLGLPYEQGEDKRRFTMYIYLPNKHDGLHNLVEKIDSESDLFESYVPSEKVEVQEVKIPKFKISYGFEASDMLKKLGLVLAFKPGGLTKMVNSSRGEDLFISSIHHKSFVEVNEEGTEAAAATVSISKCLSTAFIVNHPFLFVIKEDKSGTVLFMGYVVDPSVS